MITLLLFAPAAAITVCVAVRMSSGVVPFVLVVATMPGTLAAVTAHLSAHSCT